MSKVPQKQVTARKSKPRAAAAGLPKGWGQVTLGDIASLCRDKWNPLKEKGDKTSIELQDIEKNSGRILSTSSAKDKRSVQTIFSSGDVLFGKLRPNLRKYALPAFSGVCGSEILVLQVNKKVCIPSYLFYAVQMPSFTEEACRTTGTKMPRADWKHLVKHKISLPPLSEQKAIANMLLLWDEAIEIAERLITAKQKRFGWLLDKLVNAPAQSGKSGWKKVRIEKLLDEDIRIERGKPLTKKAVSEGDVPVVASGQTYAYYTDSATHTMPTVTISASGDAGFIWQHDYPIWASDCNVLYATNGSTQFLYYALKTIQGKMYSLQSGSAHRHVYAKDIIRLSIPWTSPKEQKKVAEVLSNAQRDIDLMREIVKRYRVQKHGLMQRLLTGEWRTITSSSQPK